MDEKSAKETKYYKGDVNFTKEEIDTLTSNGYTIKDNKSIAKKEVEGGIKTIQKEMIYTMKDDISYQVRFSGNKDWKKFKELTYFSSLSQALKATKPKLEESFKGELNMFGSRYLAEAFLNESQDHKLSVATRKELESLGFKELNDGSFMITPTGKMTEVITVEKEGTGLLVRWSVKNKHDYKEITVDEVGKFVKSIISKFGASKVPGKIQESIKMSDIQKMTPEELKKFLEPKITTERLETILDNLTSARKSFERALIGIHPVISEHGTHENKNYEGLAQNVYASIGHSIKDLKDEIEDIKKIIKEK